MNKFLNEAFTKIFIVFELKLACTIKLWLLRGQQFFTSCSVELQLDPRNVWSTKLSVRKTIWEFEEFPERNMTLSRGSLKANSFEMNEFSNQPLNKINNNFHEISLLFHTVLESEPRIHLSTVHLDFS